MCVECTESMNMLENVRRTWCTAWKLRERPITALDIPKTGVKSIILNIGHYNTGDAALRTMLNGGWRMEQAVTRGFYSSDTYVNN